MLRFLTAGESHGRSLVGIIEGLPSGIRIDLKFIQAEMARRRLGFGRSVRQSFETDVVEVLGGVRHGKTLGSPIAIKIDNKDWKNWSDIMAVEPNEDGLKRVINVPRPGHADYVGGKKYDHSDLRNGLERASARETAIRVALAAIAKLFLKSFDVHIASRVINIGGEEDSAPLCESVKGLNAKVDLSPVRCLGKQAEAGMMTKIESAKKQGNTLGGIFEVLADGVPLGLGSYAQWDRRIEGDIAKAFMSLNAIKGCEVGLGFLYAKTPGSAAHDEFVPTDTSGILQSSTNRSGGIDGGMTSGQIVSVKAVMKPLATLMRPVQSVDMRTNETTKAHVERSDVCAVPAAAVIGEGLLALELTRAMLGKFGGDSMNEVRDRVEAWKEKTAAR